MHKVPPPYSKPPKRLPKIKRARRSMAYALGGSLQAVSVEHYSLPVTMLMNDVPADCVQRWCAGGVLGPCDQTCCKLQPVSQQSCLLSSLGASATASTIDTNQEGCSTAWAIISYCEAQTSGFLSLDNSKIADCLCYDASSSYVPTIFDDAASSCYELYLTSNTTAASIFSTDIFGACTKYIGSSASASITATSGATSVC